LPYLFMSLLNFVTLVIVFSRRVIFAAAAAEKKVSRQFRETFSNRMR